MSTHRAKVNLFQVQHDRSISAIVRTVNAAFSSDPLIRWLRPNAIPWAEGEPSAWKWQYRRVQTVMSSGKVLYSANVGQIAHEFPLKGQKSTSAGRDNAIPEKSISTSVRENSDIQSSREDPGAVVFLFPPKGHCGWTISSLWLACKLWLLELISPANDEGCKSARVDKLVEENHKCKKALQAKYSASKLWYLEVIAVHPALQSRGLGAGVMRSVLDLVADQPIYLECTRYENIGFYENFGFRVIEKVELTDAPTHEGEVPNLNYWVMVRSAEVS